MKHLFQIPVLFVFSCFLFLFSDAFSQHDTIRIKGVDTSPDEVADLTLFETYESVSLDDLFIGGSNAFYIFGEEFFIISQDDFQIYKYDEHFNLKKIYGGTGRGPGEGTFIHSYEITTENILLYDTNLRKFICFSHDGRLLFEQMAQSSAFPYNITDLIQLRDDVYLAVGISSDDELNNLYVGQPYKNVYLLRINSNTAEILDSASILPQNIKNGIPSLDVITSTVSYPFKLSRHKENIYMYNFASGEIFEIGIKGNSITTTRSINITDSYFKERPEITRNEFNRNPSLREEWLTSGNFLVDVFENSNSIIFYISNIIEIGHSELLLLFIDPETYHVQHEIMFQPGNTETVRKIDDDKIHFFSLNYDTGDYIYSSISLSEFHKE